MDNRAPITPLYSANPLACWMQTLNRHTMRVCAEDKGIPEEYEQLFFTTILVTFQTAIHASNLIRQLGADDRADLLIKPITEYKDTLEAIWNQYIPIRAPISQEDITQLHYAYQNCIRRIANELCSTAEFTYEQLASASLYDYLMMALAISRSEEDLFMFVAHAVGIPEVEVTLSTDL